MEENGRTTWRAANEDEASSVVTNGRRVCGGARINPRIAFGLNVHGRCPKNKMAILKNESFK